MKILIINTSDSTGGAAIAASRLTEALSKQGIDAKMLVGNKQTASPLVVPIKGKTRFRFNFLYERLVIWIENLFSRTDLFKVSIANTGMKITKLKEFRDADIIHLHWINQGMLSLKEIKRILRSGKKVVWTLHDMWPLTGICHHADLCNGYERQCGHCLYVRFPSSEDLSFRVWRKKRKIYNRSIRIVAVSNWLAWKVERSSLLRNNIVTVIPNTLSLDSFRMLNKQQCRKELNLPADKSIILFGAARIDDPIKGFGYLADAIRRLIDKNIIRAEQMHLLLFGNWKGDRKQLDQLPVSHTYLGTVATDELSKLYSAADVLVSSSLYETFGQTIIEAQACGCIPVSFDNSGQMDIIEHKENGFLAGYLSVKSLAEGIRWALQDAPGQVSVHDMRQTVEQKYSEETVARQYIEIYNNL